MPYTRNGSKTGNEDARSSHTGNASSKSTKDKENEPPQGNHVNGHAGSEEQHTEPVPSIEPINKKADGDKLSGSRKRSIDETRDDDASKPTTDSQGDLPGDDCMPPDRRPTPGRIINPRAVNEEGAEPIRSRGDPDEWPARDKDYSNRSYMHYNSTGQYMSDDDAPQGPPKKKGRRKNPDRVKWEEEQPLKDPNCMFHDLHLCYSRGPNGRPTYDTAGFQLDYNKVADWMKPSRPKPVSDKAMKHFEKQDEDLKKMIDIFFEIDARPKESRAHSLEGPMKDRVSKDLGVRWHEVGLEHFQEWEKKGFKKAQKGEYQKFSAEYDERLMSFMEGSALRVGPRRP